LQQQDVYFKPFARNGTAGKAQDELDIVHLIAGALRYINHFRVLLLSFAIAGLAAGLCLYFTSPKKSSSKLILHSNLLTNQEGIEVIEEWNDLLAKGQRSTLASIMNSRESTLKKLSHISAEEVQKVYVQNNPNGFTVGVTVSDTSVLDELQAGIVYGLNTTPYVKERLLSRREKYNQLIANTKTEIEKLNFTKNAIDKMISGSNSGSAPLVVDISRLNLSWIELNEKLLAYQEELKFLAGVYVLEDFHKRTPGRSLLRPLFFGLAGGCFLGYIISLLLYIRQKLKFVKANYTHQ
jgi:hypothetical protein